MKVIIKRLLLLFDYKINCVHKPMYFLFNHLFEDFKGRGTLVGYREHLFVPRLYLASMKSYKLVLYTNFIKIESPIGLF